MSTNRDCNDSIKQPQIPGYRLLAKLYASDRTLVYRAIPEPKPGDNSDRDPVIVKILRQQHPSLSEIVQFRNQYTLLHHLSIPGVVRPLKLQSWQQGYLLVLEDFGGVSLREYLKEHSLSIGETLAIAQQLATILQGIHQQHIVHKDINPANIVIHPLTREVKLTDFGIASLLVKENQELQSLQGLQGTFAYLAPEQTGRMNRAIDYRADFYALGVTLFELFTGKLPFWSLDPIELVHAHLAQQPPSLESLRPDLPPVLSDLVAKLMAKNAEDRYQSARGLAQDVENCLRQWQTTGEIEAFTLATCDVSDRFLIPEKLYGREVEVQKLLAAFDRVASRSQPEESGASALVLVAGFSGIGKTAVVHEIHKPIARQRGYFIQGKFDQFHRDLPFFAFVQAFRDLMGQLLAESDTQLAIWKEMILAAVGENAQVMIDVIPELEPIIGTQAPSPELSGVAAQNRFNLVFQKFIAVFTQPEHPLVIFLDDLQWADSASLQLLPLLLGKVPCSQEGDRLVAQCGHLLLIGAYRDNEVFPAHPLMLTLAEVEQTGAMVDKIELQPLSAETINCLVADTLNCAAELAVPLSDLVMQKTQGNPFFATQFLQGLYRDGAIAFDARSGYWQCDLAWVSAAALTDDVVEFMAQQLQKLPADTQGILKLAACVGNQFDLHTLAIVSQKSHTDTATALWTALAEGLILPQTEIYKFYWGEASIDRDSADARTVKYRFLHDRVQQAAYSLIPADQKPSTHLKIGRLLWDTYTHPSIFELVNQLNLGRQLLAQAEEKRQLATLNVAAGRQAKQSTAYAAAGSYFLIAIELVGNEIWQRDYTLALELYTHTLEISYLQGNFAEMERWFTTLAGQVRSDLDLVKAQEIRIEALVAQGKLLESVNLGVQVLAQFGIEFPAQPTPEDYTTALARTQAAIGDRAPASLIDLPLATTDRAIAPLRILSQLAAPIYLAAPQLYPLIPCCGVELSVQQGISTPSSYIFSGYGLLHCALLNDYRRGTEFGQLALELSTKLDDREFRARVLFMNGFFLVHWTGHLRQTLALLQAGYTTGLDNGDSSYTAYSAYAYCFHNYFLGQPLAEWLVENKQYGQAIERLNQGTILNYHQIYRQIALNLATRSSQPWELCGDVYDEVEMLPIHQSTNDVVALAHLYINKLVINTWFENWDLALQASDSAVPCLSGAAALVTTPIYYFYDSLARLATARVAGNLDRVLPRIEQNRQKLAMWAQSAPMNYQHKLDLLDAELHYTLGEKSAAIGLYDRAIAGAKENGYLQEEAYAQELAAKFYLDWGTETTAVSYMQQAYYGYVRWGAEAKIDRLEREYLHLLADILHRDRLSLTSQPQIEPTLTKSVITTNGVQNAWFDFPAIMKAAQTISQEIELDRLLSTVMQIAIANAGAQSGHLILRRDGEWFVVATANCERARTLDLPLDRCIEVPQSLIYTVARTQETAVFDNLSSVERLAGDPHFLYHQPRSVICTPINHQGKAIGILYLVNNLVTGAFTRERIEVLQLLIGQAAISLENARLYQQTANYSRTLELEVERKTQALQQKATDLELANEKLLRATRLKDEFLANMSHELRTPLNAILGMTEGLEDEVFGQINREQLKALKTIERSGSHLLELINDILDVAKIESGQIDLNLTPTNLANLCQASLAFVKPQAQKKQLQLELMLPAHLPDIWVDERRIRQVLINLLNNAVKFTPAGGNITLAVSYLPALDNSPTGECLKIAVIDTGIGIAPADIDKLFQPFIQIDSALNRQYQGTGLGLALVKRIVELHGGQVGLTSTVGVGSCFSIVLPYTRDGAAVITTIDSPALSRNVATTAPVPPAAPLILLAEDNEANINMFSSYLETKGYRLTVAKNGREAIELARSQHPNLILMDVQMPEMDGIEAMQHIRQDSTLVDVPIIALTALAMPADRDRCLEAGANEYLSKPVKLKQLAESIQSMLAIAK
jgi:predicted ATPase/signal transduction histidine kinase/CheY-like chemotaxis protein/tRNA A-37 threonylcarbamoyl transferase component Bud32